VGGTLGQAVEGAFSLGGRVMRLIFCLCAMSFIFLSALSASAEIKVKDGDSVIKDGQEYRLRNHNAPEIGKPGGPGGAKCYEERRLGLLAARRLGQLIRDGQKRGTLEFKDHGIKDSTHMKRPLATIMIDGKDVGKTLREEGLVKSSSGPCAHAYWGAFANPRTRMRPPRCVATLRGVAALLSLSIGQEALRRVKPALGKASTSFPALKLEEIWSGYRLDFRVRALGQVAAGNVQVGDDSVRLEVTLPWLLHKFGEAVQKPSPAEVKSCVRRNRKATFGVLMKEDLGGATGRHHRPSRFTGFWRLEGHPPVRLAVGPSGKAPLTAEMEFRVLGIADRPPAVMLLEGGYRLVLLFLGHDTSFQHAHGARQNCLLRVGSCLSYGNGLCALQYARRRARIGHRERMSQRERGAERLQATADCA
jgi:Putative polyhydroxyalkanoic acid system protein (PHA_gran_rgn)